MPISRQSLERQAPELRVLSPNQPSTPDALQIQHLGLNQRKDIDSRALNGARPAEQSPPQIHGDVQRQETTTASHLSRNEAVPSQLRMPSQTCQIRDTLRMLYLQILKIVFQANTSAATQPLREGASTDTVESFGDNSGSKFEYFSPGVSMADSLTTRFEIALWSFMALICMAIDHGLLWVRIRPG